MPGFRSCDLEEMVRLLLQTFFCLLVNISWQESLYSITE